MIGIAVALNWSLLIAVALAGVYFIYSATIEERNLTEQFPDTYTVYRHSTKMLVPSFCRSPAGCYDVSLRSSGMSGRPVTSAGD